jgi:outer membrane lipoprotein-sorting protein
MRIFILFITLFSSLFALSAQSIIADMEANTRGDNTYTKMQMIVQTKRGERTMKMESFDSGTQKSFIKILYPKKDRGITFLKLNNQMWQYVPRIEKTIKIPSSMMMQSWMGSDFSNDDLVKESSLSRDYIKKIVTHVGEIYTIALIPLEEASVVWGKIEIEVDTKRKVALRTLFYDEDDLLVRTLIYSEFKHFDDRIVASKMVMTSVAKPKNMTTILFDDMNFHKRHKSDRFNKRALKKYSR